MTTETRDKSTRVHTIQGECGHRWQLRSRRHAPAAKRLLCHVCERAVPWRLIDSTTVEAQPQRTCRKCGCILRTTNPDDLCNPCNPYWVA